MNMPLDISLASKEVQARYLAMIADGQSERWAEMCALQQPPGTQGSDRAFMERRYNQEWLSDMPPHQARRILREAKAAGIDTTGKFYFSGLADRRGHTDPEAWVDSRADVERVAKKRNLTVQGSVNVSGTVEEPKPKKISKRLEDNLVRHYQSKDPKLSKNAAKEIIRQKHVPEWKRKK